MKKLLTLVFLFIAAHSWSQTVYKSIDSYDLFPGDLNTFRFYGSNAGKAYNILGSALMQSLVKYTDTSAVGDRYRAWVAAQGFAASSDLSGYVQKVTQTPTATLTGGTTVELMSAGADLSYTLNWSAGRLAGSASQLPTDNITTINVAGINQTFSNPAPGATVSGTQAVTVTRNSSTTFTNAVTAADSKTASATTSVTFLPKRYWFYSTSATPTSSDVVAALGGGGELSTAVSKSSFTITTSGGNQYLSYAYPSNEAALTSINIGGFESISSFTQRTVSVTNASGYVQNYRVYTSNNQLPPTTINQVQ